MPKLLCIPQDIYYHTVATNLFLFQNAILTHSNQVTLKMKNINLEIIMQSGRVTQMAYLYFICLIRRKREVNKQPNKFDNVT